MMDKDHAPSVAAPPKHYHQSFAARDACESCMATIASAAALRAESVAAPSVDPKLLAVVLHQAGVCVQPGIPGFERKHAWDHEQAAKTILTMLGAAAPPALDAATASKLERLEAVESGRELPRYMIRNRDAVHVPIRYEPEDTAATPASGEPAAPCVRVSNPDQGIDSHWCLTHDAEWLLGAARCVARGSAPPAAGAEPPR